jgi:mediator of RNA polymerase II transcription subunit 21
MTDKLTQLQDALDQLLTQVFSSIRYIDTRHPYISIPGQSNQNPFATDPNSQQTGHPSDAQTTQQQQQENQQLQAGEELPPDNPEVFQEKLKELARDLVLKEQQIEFLIETLPGLGNSQEDQEKRIKELEGQLREVESERAVAEKERAQLVELVEGRILGVRRV